jgi:hypothetical protein
VSAVPEELMAQAQLIAKHIHNGYGEVDMAISFQIDFIGTRSGSNDPFVYK